MPPARVDCSGVGRLLRSTDDLSTRREGRGERGGPLGASGPRVWRAAVVAALGALSIACQNDPEPAPKPAQVTPAEVATEAVPVSPRRGVERPQLDIREPESSNRGHLPSSEAEPSAEQLLLDQLGPEAAQLEDVLSGRTPGDHERDSQDHVPQRAHVKRRRVGGQRRVRAIEVRAEVSDHGQEPAPAAPVVDPGEPEAAGDE